MDLAEEYNSSGEDMSEDVSSPEGEAEESDESSDSLYIPESSLGGKTCKPGDTLTFKVVGKSDGELEIALEDKQYEDSDETDANELRQALGPMTA